MEMNKIVNLDAEELALQMRQAAEQVFRLRFQLSMGQSEGLKKYRALKKDIARIRTVERQRELGITAPSHPAETEPKKAHRKPAKSRSRASRSKSGPAKKSAKKSTQRVSKSASRGRARSASKAKSAGTRTRTTAKRGKANAKKGS